MKKLKFIFIFIFGFLNLSFAEESITITTYYPSPYGSYNELQSNKLAVGDTNSDGQLTFADLPPANGQIYVARSVIYKPQSFLSAADVRKGEVMYDNTTDSLRYYNGSSWQAMGGGISYTYYCFTRDDYGGTPVCTNSGGTQGYCPSGYTQKLALGAWGYCDYFVSGSYTGQNYLLPPGGSCSAGNNLMGSAYVCSQ